MFFEFNGFQVGVPKQYTRKGNMKTLVTISSHPLGHSLARRLWERAVPRGRQVCLDAEAHIVLYDEVRKAVEGFEENPRILRIVVAYEMPRHLPKGIFWIKPDTSAFTSLIRALNPGGVP